MAISRRSLIVLAVALVLQVSYLASAVAASVSEDESVGFAPRSRFKDSIVSKLLVGMLAVRVDGAETNCMLSFHIVS